jgi:hypothetical protein
MGFKQVFIAKGALPKNAKFEGVKVIEKTMLSEVIGNI